MPEPFSKMLLFKEKLKFHGPDSEILFKIKFSLPFSPLSFLSSLRLLPPLSHNYFQFINATRQKRDLCTRSLSCYDMSYISCRFFNSRAVVTQKVGRVARGRKEIHDFFKLFFSFFFFVGIRKVLVLVWEMFAGFTLPKAYLPTLVERVCFCFFLLFGLFIFVLSFCFYTFSGLFMAL